MEWVLISGCLLWLCILLYAKFCALQNYMRDKGYKIPNEDESYAYFTDVLKTWKK